MSGTTPTAMPPLPRLLSVAGLLSWASQLCNAIELQMRRLTATPTISDVPDVNQTATGTNQATAFQITSSLTIFSSVPLNTGAVVPAVAGKGLLVNGDSTNTLYLYAAIGGTIQGGATVSVSPMSQVWWSVASATVAYAA